LSGVIAIDGKSVCGSGNATEKPLHLLNAFTAETHLVLGQLATDVKSNEITAIPELPELLSIKGMVVTLDAILIAPEEFRLAAPRLRPQSLT
jgi:hypothetical protein